MLYFTCPNCGAVWSVEDESDPDIILMPWPHIECDECGEWIPVF